MNKHRHSIPRELEEMKLIRNSHKHWETECHECFIIKAITYYVPFTYTNIQFEIILKVTVRQYNCYNIDYCVKILYA